MVEVLREALEDSFKLFPFLFLTYLVMGLIQHTAGEKSKKVIQEAGRVGPVWGSLCGAFPQCGFSAAASYFYVGRVITLGTLISIYMSTSDEMLPILISEQVRGSVILKILLTKVLIGMVSGFFIELVFGWMGRRNRMPKEFVRNSTTDCSCGHGLISSALFHSLQVWVFIVLISMGIGVLIHLLGDDTISSLFSDIPVLGEMISGLVGLIPNCAASVVITQLYIDGVIGAGPMLSGLLVSAGVGLLVLFKENHHLHENLFILLMLYGLSVGWGVLADFLQIVF